MIKYECLRKFIVFSKRYLDYLLVEFTTFCNEHYAHGSRNYLTPTSTEPSPDNNQVDLQQITARNTWAD